MNRTAIVDDASRPPLPDPTALPASIRLLRRLNPGIAALLHSPLHGLASRDLLLFTYVGRRSGARRSLPLSYVESGGQLVLCTRSSAWWKSARANPRVEVQLRGRRVEATARVLDPTSPEALDGFRAFLTRNPRTGELLYQVRRGADGRPREDDLAREVLRSVVVHLVVGA